MKKILAAGLILANSVCYGQSSGPARDYPIQPVGFTQVRLTDAFWSPRIEKNRTVTIPASFARCESTGRVSNFVMAAHRQGKFCTKFPFDDTDIYKTIEGASYSLAVHPDPELSAYVDRLIDTVARAQEPDGYLYTARTIDSLHPHPWSGMDRWIEEHNMSHELYNSGHLFEAASAHYLATGQRNLLDVALKNADLLVRTFGPGRLWVAHGHEIVEMGLVRLYRITGKREYLDLAKFFIEARGHRQYDTASSNEFKNGQYWQDDKPVVDQDEAEGHAVRAMYLYSGMADVAALTGDKAFVDAIDRIWDDMSAKKVYVQGSIGAVPDGERFGKDYELPNITAYNETCAAIGEVFWNERMFLLHGDSRYIDLLEKVLYNGMLSGVGLDGKSFFYTNAMQVIDGVTHPALEAQRSGWFECSCCPTNMLRLLPSLPGYVYAQKGRELFINLFVSDSARLTLDGHVLQVVQKNNYPWDGRMSFTILPEEELSFALKLRIPGWARGEAIPGGLYHYEGGGASAGSPGAASAGLPAGASAFTPVVVRVNGVEVSYRMDKGYAVVDRPWKKGDKVTMELPMRIQRVVASGKLPEDSGKVAIQRGPLIYCAEGVDNSGKLSALTLPKSQRLTAAFHPQVLDGVEMLEGRVKLIPYYAWANRGKSEMTVWINESAGTGQ